MIQFYISWLKIILLILLLIWDLFLYINLVNLENFFNFFIVLGICSILLDLALISQFNLFLFLDYLFIEELLLKLKLDIIELLSTFSLALQIWNVILLIKSINRWLRPSVSIFLLLECDIGLDL